MRIYKPSGEHDVQLVQPVDAADYERLNALLDGTSRRLSWVPLRVKVVTEDEKPPTP